MDRLVLPCNIGDIVYIVRDYNKYYDTGLDRYNTRYNTEVVVDKFKVIEFIFDEEGFNIAINTMDGYLKLKYYYNLTLIQLFDCKIFTTIEGAAKYLDVICD